YNNQLFFKNLFLLDIVNKKINYITGSTNPKTKGSTGLHMQAYPKDRLFTNIQGNKGALRLCLVVCRADKTMLQE
ncbi:MAG: hypothetical protein ACK424_04255, partial [Candidatus Thermochlorobacter sp.]